MKTLGDSAANSHKEKSLTSLKALAAVALLPTRSAEISGNATNAQYLVDEILSTSWDRNIALDLLAEFEAGSCRNGRQHVSWLRA